MSHSSTRTRLESDGRCDDGRRQTDADIFSTIRWIKTSVGLPEARRGPASDCEASNSAEGWRRGQTIAMLRKSQSVLIIDDVISASAAERSSRQTQTQHPVSAPGWRLSVMICFFSRRWGSDRHSDVVFYHRPVEMLWNPSSYRADGST